jgi:hypothetical protein
MPEASHSGHPVLQVFGLELEVSNSRLADLLTMDAKDALTTDVRDLGAGERVSAVAAEAFEAAPDVVLAPTVARDAEEARVRQEFRAAVREVGEALSFDAGADGLWRSSEGVVILTRAIERPLSFAAAVHYVTELASRREAIAGSDSTALFVTVDQQTADVFKVAVRQRRLHGVMRTVSFDNLMELRSLHASGGLDHRQTVALLVPLVDIDVGEILSIVHASRADAPGAGG